MEMDELIAYSPRAGMLGCDMLVAGGVCPLS